MGIHVSFLPAVISTLEKALNSYSSDTDPTNLANPMTDELHEPVKSKLGLSQLVASHTSEVAYTFPQTQPKEEQGCSQRSYTAIVPTHGMSYLEAHGGWWSTEAGLVCTCVPEVTIGLCGSYRFTWEKLIIS